MLSQTSASAPRLPNKAQTLAPAPNPNKVGWRVKEWCRDAALSPATAYILIADGRIESVKHGKARIILTPPKEYLESLKRWTAGLPCPPPALIGYSNRPSGESAVSGTHAPDPPVKQAFIVSGWRAVVSGSMLGFFNLRLPSGLVINDLTLHQ